MRCPNLDCQEEVPDHLRDCVVCGTDAKPPNVRAAGRVEEVQALGNRFLEAEQAAKNSGKEQILKDFRLALTRSGTIICRSLGQINALLSGDNVLFASFYQTVSSESRLPEDNEWDKIRQAADALLFPYYYQNLRFGVLSLNSVGVTGYGDYSIKLKEGSIKERATVFEENTINFVKKFKIGDPIPPGYRALWGNREKLAVSKLESKLTLTTAEDNFPSILIDSSATDGEFIEVHIYGPIHRRAIAEISGPTPRLRPDRVLLSSVKEKLREIGAICNIP